MQQLNRCPVNAWHICSMQATNSGFSILNPAGAVQAVLAVAPGNGTIDIHPNGRSQDRLTLIDSAGNSFQANSSSLSPFVGSVAGEV